MKSLIATLTLMICLLPACAFAQTPVPIPAEPDNSVADPAAIVISGQARFTVLTPQLIRMEWSANSQFEDHASLVFINRRLPVPKFTQQTKRGWLIIDTGKLTLRYKLKSGTFTSQNLSVAFSLNGKTVTWNSGVPDTGNLGGTTRTLDGANGAVPLESGLLSRDGWVMIDDTSRPLFDSSDWPWALPRPAAPHQDWYFFAYGHDYRGELRDFTRVAGRIPLPPRFVFGAWWSRYWAYTDEELQQLIEQFHTHEVPLDVLVVDMDWHPTFGVRWWENRQDPSGHTVGWTGYSWSPLYFPDPAGFIGWVHDQGLKLTLNMHPASGVQPFETAYPEMARAMGIDPATKQYVKFDIADKKFATNYMNLLHHPLEKQGVDFFWLDWQQERTTTIENLSPTWWLNYVHFTDMEREGKRPLLFHRWGGLGNHRYEIGFSGDTTSTWPMLAFEPYFTATAANVGYGYWSHDIGGHLPGTVDAELYTRWVQWGAFSPVLRTHTTKNPQSERRIWAFPDDYAAAMRKAFLERYALVPYIYTAARESYDSGVSLLHPLYYDSPESDEAYSHDGGYAFGNDLIAAPVVTPQDPEVRLATRSLWLPKGEWIEWPTGAHFEGPLQITRSFALDEVPVYLRAGAIIPMAPQMSSTNAKPLDPLILEIAPGKEGQGSLYEDAGDSLGYKKSEFTWTHFRQRVQPDGSLEMKILPREGSFPGMLTGRGYELRLYGTWPPESVPVNGQPVTPSPNPGWPVSSPPAAHAVAVPPVSVTVPESAANAAPNSAATVSASSTTWRYDGETTTIIITLPKLSVTQEVDVRVSFPKLAAGQQSLLNGLPGKIARLHGAMHILENSWDRGWAPDILIDAAQSGHRVTLHPETALAEYQKLSQEWPDILAAISAMDVDKKFTTAALAHLKSAQQ